MIFINSLRGRVTAAFFLGALGLSTLLLLTADYFAEGMEIAFSSNRLAENMARVLKQARAGADVVLPYSATMRGYAFAHGQPAALPSALTGLAPGSHELVVDDRELQVLVHDEGETRYILTYDSSQLEDIEKQLEFWLFAGVFLIGCASIGYGYLMSARIVRPITALADAVDSLGTEHVVLPVDPGPTTRDEVTRLRYAFHAYSVRLRDFIERERTFTADASHELRNPTMAATNAVELLEARRDLDAKTAGQIARVRRAVDRMKELIELFLALSREPETMLGETDPVFDVADIARNVVARHTDAAASKGLTLSLNVLASSQGRGDPSMAEVALENIVGNAVRYTLEGQIDVVVESDSIVVADTGPGVSATEQRRVLERMARGTAGRASNVAGFGLGLSIVSRLCEHQGWKFRLQSGSETGTRATVCFDDKVRSEAGVSAGPAAP